MSKKELVRLDDMYFQHISNVFEDCIEKLNQLKIDPDEREGVCENPLIQASFLAIISDVATKYFEEASQKVFLVNQLSEYEVLEFASHLLKNSRRASG
jgi:hypothetical protein